MFSLFPPNHWKNQSERNLGHCIPQGPTNAPTLTGSGFQLLGYKEQYVRFILPAASQGQLAGKTRVKWRNGNHAIVNPT